MNRRDLMKAASAFVLMPPRLAAQARPEATAPRAFASDWHTWPDVPWAGPECWGNRLQDWRVHAGRLECLVAGRNRTVHCLTARIGEATGSFSLAAVVERGQDGARASVIASATG